MSRVARQLAKVAGKPGLCGAPIMVFDDFTAGVSDDVNYAETLSREVWGGDNPAFVAVASVVAVDRLREVACLYGFIRLKAAPTAIDNDLEELNLSVKGAALASKTDWLPAVEQLGGGVFLRFDEGVIEQRLSGL